MIADVHEDATETRRVVKNGSLSLTLGRAIRCMKAKKLLRTEFYRTRSAGTKTESVNPKTPRILRRPFLRRLRLLSIILRLTLNPKLATGLEHVIQTGAEK
jgi:hypothetical protein